MKDLNRPHEAPVREFLENIVRQPEAHARFMNMLSMLEHQGSRRIMLTQSDKPESLTEDTLKHLAEEARHAYFFKRQAERVAGHALDGYTDENTMCRIPALMYFARMDAGITKALRREQKMLPSRKRGSDQAAVKNPRFRGECREGDDAETLKNDPYPWVSLIIELRACWLYHIYHEVLQDSDLTLSLKSLLAEEDMHLAEMFEMCGENTKRLRALSAYETGLFGRLWAQLEGAFESHVQKAEVA